MHRRLLVHHEAYALARWISRSRQGTLGTNLRRSDDWYDWKLRHSGPLCSRASAPAQTWLVVRSGRLQVWWHASLRCLGLGPLMAGAQVQGYLYFAALPSSTT